MNLEDLNVDGRSARIEFNYWGGLDFPNDENDHVVNFKINDQVLGSDTFDGVIERNKEFPIDVSNLVVNSSVNIEVPATTINQIDIVSVESIALTYPALFNARDNQFTFTSENDNFKVSGFSDKSLQLFVLSDYGIVKLKKFKTGTFEGKNQVIFSGLNGLNTYFISTDGSVLKPQMKFSSSEPVNVEATEHLIISHADFIGPELIDYANDTRQNYRVVNVENIYHRYSNKIPDGEAIKTFIQDTAAIGELKSILIVGGDNYDYNNNLGLDVISFVPTIYRETDKLIKYSAVDALFGDTNNDDIPDVAVGRLPVRTQAELSAILNKSLAYNNQSYNPSVVLAADDSDGYDAYDFSLSSDLIAYQFDNANWNVEKAYLDSLPLEAARNLLIGELNSGARLAMYTGHSSSKRWAFEGIFRNSDVNNLMNENNPFGIVQWGCWNTYFVHPEEDSLGHAFMLSGNKGAAFVMGASTLTNASEESRFSSLFNIYMLANDLTIGEAMTQAKYEYNNESNQLHKDILWGISLLGDPLTKINAE